MKAKRAQPLQFFENLPANVALPLPSYPLARRIYTWTAYQDGERCSVYIPFCSGFVRSSPANAIFLESMNPREFWANEGNVSTINFIKFWKKCTKLRIYNCWKRCGTSEWVLKKSRLTMRSDKSGIQSGKVWKVKSYAPREKNMAAGRNERKKKRRNFGFEKGGYRHLSTFFHTRHSSTPKSVWRFLDFPRDGST